jgi:hypothetical protein
VSRYHEEDVETGSPHEVDPTGAEAITEGPKVSAGQLPRTTATPGELLV